MSRLARFSIVQLALGAVHIRGLWLYKNNNKESATRWLFMACFLHGVGIWLTAQIYHLDDRLPNGVLLWAAGALPYVLIFKAKPFVILCSSLSCLWLSYEFDFSWSGSLLVYPLFMGAFFLALRRQVFGFYTAFFPALSLFLWIENLIIWKFSPPAWQHPVLLHIVLFLATAFSLTEAGAIRNHTGHLRFGLIKILLAILLILTYEEPLRHLLCMNHYRPDDFSPAIIAALMCFYAIIQLAVLPSVKKFSLPMKNLITAQIILVIFFSCRFFLGRESELVRLLVGILHLSSNLIALITAILLIGRGIRENCTSFFYLGVCYMILLALCRYFDLLGGYIGGAFAFALSGLILYLSARYFAAKQSREDA